VALTGFNNIDDWLLTEIPFKETVAELVGEGVSKLDIVTIKVCHGGDCEVFWEQGSYRRDLLPGEMLEEAKGLSFLRNQSTHTRHLLTTKTDVTFQVNVPPDSRTTNAKIYAAVAFPSFLSRLSISYGSKIGLAVSASFLVSPGLVTEQKGEIWNKPATDYTSDAAKPNQTDPAAFLDSFKEQTPLTIGVVFGIAFSSLSFVVVGLMYFVVIPRYKRSIEKRQRAKVDADNLQAKKRAIHPSVNIPGALGLEKPQGTDGGGGDDEGVTDEGLAGVGHQKRRPPRILDHGHHLQKHVHGVIDNISSDSDDLHDDPGELPGGATETEKFGYAKRRLQQLQDQLDSILTADSDGARAPESQPFEPSISLADSQTGSYALRQSGRLPPLILGMGGGKAQTLVTSSSNFEAPTLVRTGAAGSSGAGGTIGHTQKAAMDAGWGPSDDKEIVKGADGRRMRPAGQAPEFGLQPVPPPARRPPQVNDAGASSRTPVGSAIRAHPLLNDPG
jgi:hypothetical protein